MLNRDCYLTDKAHNCLNVTYCYTFFIHVIIDIEIKTLGMLGKYFTYEWYPQTLLQAFTKF